MYDILENVAASATGADFERPLDEVLQAYSEMGYRKFEVYTGGRRSSLDLRKPPEFYLEKGQKYGLKFSSMHLSVIDEETMTEGLNLAIQQASYAQKLGIRVVIFKAHTKAVYIKLAKLFLDAIKNYKLITVIQIHEGGAFNNLEDLIEVFNNINDPRMKLLLEVGTLHAFGITWEEACRALGGRIALVHIKDMIGAQSVPFGTGEVNIPGLFKYMRQHGYEGDFIVEIDPQDKENTRVYIQNAIKYIQIYCN